MKLFNFWLPTLVILTILTGCASSTPVERITLEETYLSQVPSTLTQQAPIVHTAVKTTQPPTPTQITPTASDPTQPPRISPTEEPISTSTETTAPTATSRPNKPPQYWTTLPVIPEISDNVVEIYKRGQELGNNPNTFSKIGDCGSTPAWFLGDFDLGPDFYDLGEYQELEPVIQNFQGSYGRTSLAARSGFNASSLFVSLWADRSFCESDETPLACEYRLNRPSFAFIMLGSNDIYHPDDFEPQMRKLIEYSLENGIIPILSTKADNEEGDHSINTTIAHLAYEYDIPLWNYWLAVQPLPDQGLQEDQVHLTWGRNFFNDPDAMQKAWPIRNLTALQILDKVWRKTTSQSSSH